MARSGVVVILVVLLAAGAAGFYRVRLRPQKSAESRIVHPEERVLAASVNATGTVRLRVGSEVRVGSQLSGIVKKLNVTVGSHVRAGEVVAEIDDAAIRARLAQAEAQIEMDRATLQRAQVNSNRAKELSDQGLLPVQQEQDLSLALAEAKARFDKSLRDADAVKVDLGYVAIRAPISGTVSSVSTQEGETVAASFTAPTFVNIIAEDALQLVAMVDETDIASVRPRNPVTFTVDSYPARDFSGAVLSVAPKATIVSGVVNYEVTIEISRGMNLLKPDMTANVAIETAQHRALLLPLAAVHKDTDHAFVYLLGPKGPERRQVVTGASATGMTEIKRGLLVSDSVLLPLDAALQTEPVQ